MNPALWSFNALAMTMTLVGGLAPSVQNLLSRKGLWRMFSLRAGLLLSVAFIEVLPGAWSHHPALAGWGALSAFALLFAMENVSMLDSCPEYLEECSVHFLGWTALAALSAHAFIDGFNLAVSFSAGTLAGWAIGFTLALHKLADGFTLTTLLRQSGYSPRASFGALALIAAATPLGSLLSLAGISSLPPGVLAGLLGFAGGSFLYIGAADILPRMHKLDDKGCLVFFVLGLIVIAALRQI